MSTHADIERFGAVIRVLSEVRVACILIVGDEPKSSASVMGSNGEVVDSEEGAMELRRLLRHAAARRARSRGRHLRSPGPRAGVPAASRFGLS